MTQLAIEADRRVTPRSKTALDGLVPITCGCSSFIFNTGDDNNTKNAGLMFNLQPLDAGYFKLLQDELKNLWIRDCAVPTPREENKRLLISPELREVWRIMKDKDLHGFWFHTSSIYPYDQVNHALTHPLRFRIRDFDSSQDTLMNLEATTISTILNEPKEALMLEEEDTTMIIELKMTILMRNLILNTLA